MGETRYYRLTVPASPPNLMLKAGAQVTLNKHPTDVRSPPPAPHGGMSFVHGDVSCSDLGRVLVLNDPTARWSCRSPTTTPTARARCS